MRSAAPTRRTEEVTDERSQHKPASHRSISRNIGQCGSRTYRCAWRRFWRWPAAMRSTIYSPTTRSRLPPAAEAAAEIDMISPPAYQVEPPDLLSIEMLKLVPLPPYRVDIYDVLQIRVIGTLARPAHRRLLPGRERGDRHARAGVWPGAGGGHDHRRGHRRRSSSKLKIVLQQPEVSVQLARTAGTAAGHRRLPGRPRRHDQPETIRHAVRGRQDGDRNPAGPGEAPGAVFRFAGGGRRGAAVQQQGVLRDHRGGGHGRQRPPHSRSPATTRCWTRWPRSTGSRKYPARRCGSPGRPPAARPASRFCRSITRRSPRAARRPRTTRLCRATGYSSPRTT